MPQQAKGPRLYLVQRKGRAQVYAIRDTNERDRSTGTADRREAEKALARYIEDKERRCVSTPDEMTVSNALALYAEEHAFSVAAPERIGYAMSALDNWWSDMPVSSVTGATCRRYARERGVAAGTVRRELGTLRAALNHCHKEGYLLTVPGVVLPEKSAPKDRWLTRDEAARLMWAARRTGNKHLCRFILIGLYTGTRKAAILALRFRAHTQGGWFDLEKGVLYRAASEARRTKKRQTPAKLPRKLLAHARRWARNSEWAVEWRGQRVADIKTAWKHMRKEAGLPDVTPHTLKHTAVTWAMQRGVSLNDASQFFGTTRDALEKNYFHHHPQFTAETAAAMDRRV